jgi:hypothetical protein
MVHNFVL